MSQVSQGHSLVEALLYGRLDGLAPETVFLYGRTGLLHLFSASGFHMQAALWLASLGARPLRVLLPHPFYREGTAFLLSLALMTFFGAVTEWSSPLVRAYSFAALLAGARLLELKVPKHGVFLLSLALAYLLGRGSLLSFLLSAAGMAGVLYGGGTHFLSLALGPWLFTLPIVAWCFGLVSLSAPLWNLTLGLALSFTVLPLAILGLLAESLGLPLPLFREAAALLMECFTGALAAGDSLLGLSFWVEGRAFLLASAALLAAYFLRRRKAAWALVLLPFLLPLPKLVLLDVGQGDSLLLRLPDRSRLLVDAGPGWKRRAPVTASLERAGTGALDHLLLTHPDHDHVGGVPFLLARHAVTTLWLRESQLDDPRLLPALEAAERAGTGTRFLGASAPPSMRCWLPPFSGNESSPLCHAPLLGGRSVWLTGDAGFPAERWLLSQGKSLPEAYFLKVGHHGSGGSSGEAFVRATGAKEALVSAGRRNRYGHPAREALARLKGLDLRRTDEEGSVFFY